MLVKDVDHRIPKWKRDENSKEKHNESTVRKQNGNDHCNENQDEILLKSPYAYLERLKIIKPLKEHQCRNKKHHRNPDQSKNRKKIIDHTPSQRIDHKQKEIVTLETRKKITRFRFLSKIQFSVDFQKTNIQRENYCFYDDHHLQKQNRIIGLHECCIFGQKSLTIRIEQTLKLLDLFKKSVIPESKRARKHGHRKINHRKQKLKRQSSHPILIGFCQ